MLRLTITVTVILTILLLATACAQAEPGWRTVVVARGAEREVLRATPVVQRPYRPLHIYGNSIRRLHYRGYVLPRPGDVRRALVAARTQ